MVRLKCGKCIKICFNKHCDYNNCSLVRSIRPLMYISFWISLMSNSCPSLYWQYILTGYVLSVRSYIAYKKVRFRLRNENQNVITGKSLKPFFLSEVSHLHENTIGWLKVFYLQYVQLISSLMSELLNLLARFPIFTSNRHAGVLIPWPIVKMRIANICLSHFNC